jgi:hypothetical protein
MNMRGRVALVFGVISLGIAAGATAQSKQAGQQPQSSPLVNELERCRQIADPAKRVACYDAASGALVQATNSGQVSVVDRKELRRARRSLFGFSLPHLPWFSGDPSIDDADRRLDSTIKSVDIVNGRFRIVLADNAIWETTEDRLNYFAPAAGQKITILRGPLGSYFLRINGQIGLRGKRVG